MWRIGKVNHSSLIKIGSVMQYSTVIVTILCMVSFSVCANDSYQSELFFNYNKIDFDGPTDLASVNVGYKFYFLPVKIKNHPSREAAFLKKASEFSIGYNKRNESGSLDNQNSDLIRAAVQYITKNTSLPISFSAQYSKQDTDLENTSINFDTKTIGFGIGAYVQDNTKISLQLSKLEFSVFS